MGRSIGNFGDTLMQLAECSNLEEQAVMLCHAVQLVELICALPAGSVSLKGYRM